MRKKIYFILIISFLLSFLSGCWSYRGLDELTIVLGVAVDKDVSSGKYKLTFEVIDLSGSVKESGHKSKIIESEGVTIFDAVRNSKRRAKDKLYFSNTKIIVISNTLAQEEGIANIIDFFIRDSEPRETLKVIISQEDSAKKILSTPGINENITSLELNRIIEDDNKLILSTINMQLYQVFNDLKTPGAALVLPAVHNEQNDEKPTNVSNGIAIFRNNHLYSYLTPEETKYYLFAVDKVKGGLLTFSDGSNNRDNITLEIVSQKTLLSFKYIDNKIKLIIEPQAVLFLSEINSTSIPVNEDGINKFQEYASEKLKQEMTDIIHKAQYNLKMDIFGYGSKIYSSQPNLWYQISGDWDNLFQTMEFEVNPSLKIINSGYSKET